MCSAVAIVFACAFLMTAANQFKGVTVDRYVRRFDPLGLLPVWTFFAPLPSGNDYHLIYRDYDATTRLVMSHEVPTLRHRLLSDSIWAHDRRRVKVIFDLCQALMRLTGETQDDDVI